MPVTCTASNLATLAACLTGLSPDQQKAIQNYLLCQIANNGGGGGSSPAVYRANINQEGTNNPDAIVLENTLGGTLVWTRQDAGIYYGTLAGAFPDPNKVFVISAAMGFVDLGRVNSLAMFWVDANNVSWECSDENQLIEYNYPARVSIQILVYP